MTNQADENQANYGYSEPVSHLLTLGRPKGRGEEDWLNYVELYGFTAEHIPELLRLYEDETFQNRSFWQTPEGVAFVHVLRVLGQLHDESALPFLLNLAETEEDSDWVWEEIPSVLAQYGSAIIPQIQAAILRKRETFILGATLIQVLEDLSEKFPETREDILQFMISVLEDFEKNDAGINAKIISRFAQEKYMPALPLIEKAFANNSVDDFYAGDWDDIQVKYGLKEHDPNKKAGFGKLFDARGGIGFNRKVDNKKNSKPDSKKKSKRKQAEKSKKQNRKRK